MGKFSESFKVIERIKNSDFERESTKEHWQLWARQILINNGYKEVDSLEQRSPENEPSMNVNLEDGDMGSLINENED